MKTELIALLTILQICNGAYILMLMMNKDTPTFMLGMCAKMDNLNSYIPFSEMSRILNLLVCFYISLVRPLGDIKL
jgi:hypothetical protein